MKKCLNWIKDNWWGIIFGVIIVVIAIAILIGAITNEKNKITEGVVVDRQYTAGYSTVGTENSPPRYVPARCTLTIAGEKNGKYVEYTFEVPEIEYAEYHVGDYYPKEKNNE